MSQKQLSLNEQFLYPKFLKFGVKIYVNFIEIDDTANKF